MQIHVVCQCPKMILLNVINLLSACDPVSAFGGIVSCNFKVNKKLALRASIRLFLEVIIGNNFDAEALKILKDLKKNLRD
jgi:phosphoribosylaminoimidazolecarboxamide formyltransferase/IMP cyclohydrolase